MVNKLNINYLILKYKFIGVIELTREDMQLIYWKISYIFLKILSDFES